MSLAPKILGGLAISWFGWLLLTPWAINQARYEERDRWFCVGAASWGELRSALVAGKGVGTLSCQVPELKKIAVCGQVSRISPAGWDGVEG